MNYNNMNYNNNNNNDNNNNTYYNRVYFCQSKIGRFECILFLSMEDAIKHGNNKNVVINNPTMDKEKHINYVSPTFKNCATIIPICKYVPFYFDNFILRFKLFNMTPLIIKKNK